MFHRMIALFLAFCWPFNLSAGPVVLTTVDGNLRIEGELLSFDGEFFRVETSFGSLTLDGGNLRCEGEGCPDPDTLVARATISGPVEMIHRLIPPLLEVFADREGLKYYSLFLSDEDVVWELRDPVSDQLLVVFTGVVEDDDAGAVRLAAGDVAIALGQEPSSPPVRQDVIALDAVLPLVAPENPRAMVTQSQLSALLSGRMDSWSLLDGPDLPIDIHALNGTEPLLKRWYASSLPDNTMRHDNANDLADAVARDPAAIGIGMYSAIGNATPLVVGGRCGLAIPATRDTIRAEDYPLTQPLFLKRMGARQPKIVRDFIGFVRSEEAQPVIASTGYVDQAIGRIPFDRQGDRIANAVLAAGDDPDAAGAVRDMVATLLNRDRLTLTFRFEDGSSELDAQSASNITRLADAINQGTFDGRRLYFIGFSDGVGPPEGNQRLSLRRSRSVRQAVASFVGTAPVDLQVAAFGEALPMACDDTTWGRQVNRRVEVWIE